MKKFNLILIAIAILFTSTLTSCKDEKDNDNIIENLGKGLFVLNEGNWEANNAALSFFDKSNSKTEVDLFEKVNNQGLGDTGNDMILFDGKLYIAVKESASLVVVNSNTGELIKRIPILNEEGKNRMPSRLCIGGSNIYLSTMDGYVLEINPFNNNITRKVKVGRNPEGLAYSNNKLYVANSGGMDYPNYDSTLSVIDVNTLVELKKINIGVNPYSVKDLGNNKIGVMVTGNYTDIPTHFAIVNTNTDLIEKSTEINMLNFELFGDKILYSNYLWGSGRTAVHIYDYNTSDTYGNIFFANGEPTSDITYPYKITVNNNDSEVYISDAKDYSQSGEVFVYDFQGNFKYKFSVANIPSVVIPKD